MKVAEKVKLDLPPKSKIQPVEFGDLPILCKETKQIFGENIGTPIRHFKKVGKIWQQDNELLYWGG